MTGSYQYRVEPMQGGSVDREELHITSTQNIRVKQVLHLREKKERDETNLFLIEGYRELLRAAEVHWEIDQLFTCHELFLGSNEGTLIQKIASNGTKVISCSKSVFQKLSYRDRPDGLLAIAKQKHLTLVDFEKKMKGKKNPLFIIAESIEKPGNLGTMLRSSDAVGLDGFIVCNRCTDIYNPNVVRASIGTLFSVPVIETSGEEALAWLKANHIAVLAATPSAKVEFTDADMNRPLAIAVGTEQLGLSNLWMQQAELQVSIPMCGIADSLNVATATTLLMYEALRQRRASI
jgi:RNA methyltransferase, TrmH family